MERNWRNGSDRQQHFQVGESDDWSKGDPWNAMKGKHRALLMLAIVSFVLPMGELLIFKRPLTTFNTYMLAELGLSAYAVYWWYVMDKRERNFRAGAFQNMGVAMFTLIGLPVYFIRSRGWGRGFVAMAAAFGVLVGVLALSFAGLAAGRDIALITR